MVWRYFTDINRYIKGLAIWLFVIDEARTGCVWNNTSIHKRDVLDTLQVISEIYPRYMRYIKGLAILLFLIDEIYLAVSD